MEASGKGRQAEALVVGAGPVGLALAIELERHGVACRIIDRNEQRTDKSKALVLWSRSLEILDDMGGAAPFVAAGMPGHGMSLYDRGKRLLHVSLDELDSPYRYALMIPQSETERLLEERLAGHGVAVERRTELCSFTVERDGVTAVLRRADGGEETVRTAWLLGCDGAHSTVRHQLGVPFAGEVEPNDWLLADVHLRGPLPEDELSVFWHPKGILAFFPIAPGRFRVIGDVGLARGLDHPPDPTLEQVQALVDERGPGGLVCAEPIWLSGFRIHERKVNAYRHGRVFLAGDAAHIHSPAGGQGMNTGIQDAYNLGWKLGLVAAGRARDTLLDSYSTERSAVGEVVLRNAALMTRVATLRNPLAQAIRGRLAPLLASFDFVRSHVASTLAELEIDYATSPLCGERRGALALGRPHGGVAAGSRAPDAAVVDVASGRAITLFEALHGTSHVLLALTGSEEPDGAARRLAGRVREVRRRFGDAVAPCLVVAGASLTADLDFPGRVLLDPQRAVHQRYAAASDALYLIRPDGYVGYRSQPADEGALCAHLETYLLPVAA